MSRRGLCESHEGTLFKEQLIYEQSAAPAAHETQEKRTCIWSRLIKALY